MAIKSCRWYCSGKGIEAKIKEIQFGSQNLTLCLMILTLLFNSSRICNDPLHGITLRVTLNHLLICYGWEGLAARTQFNCFSSNPSIKSSFKFLCKIPWARTEVEILSLASLKRKECKNSKLLE